jgi:hypothetical protein
MPAPDEERLLDELARQVLNELLRCGYTEGAARSEAASALEMWSRNLSKPN